MKQQKLDGFQDNLGHKSISLAKRTLYDLQWRGDGMEDISITII